MKKIEDYHAHAAECRSMADRARSPEDKAMLMNMAATWESLAVDRHRNIARQVRIDELEKRAAASIPIDLRMMIDGLAAARTYPVFLEPTGSRRVTNRAWSHTSMGCPPKCSLALSMAAASSEQTMCSGGFFICPSLSRT
jgi:hypothetical protein